METLTPLPATERQVDYLRDLFLQRTTLPFDEIEARLDRLSRSRTLASRAIDGLLHLPYPTHHRHHTDGPSLDSERSMRDREVKLLKVDEGRYAVPTEDGGLGFYIVNNRGTLYAQASDDRHPVHGVAVVSVLAKIAADPIGAAMRYGQEIGSCGRCGRTLTDDESRARGIGPVCFSKMEGEG